MAELHKPWFTYKVTGLGMQPVAWQGWVLMVVMFAWIAGGITALVHGVPHEHQRFAILLWLFVGSGILVLMRSRMASTRR